jgi:ketosteroid isomerase-like protein
MESSTWRDTAWAMSEENIDTVRALYGALNRGDMEGLVQYLHPEVEIHPATGGMLDMGTTYRGRDGMRQFAETAWESFDMAVEPEEITTAPGDRILATERWQMRARRNRNRTPAHSHLHVSGWTDNPHRWLS